MALRYASALELYDAGASTALLASESTWLSAGTPGDWTVVEDGMHSRRALKGAAASFLAIAATYTGATVTVIVQAAVKVAVLGAHTLLQVKGGGNLAIELRSTQAGEVELYDASASPVASSPRATLRAGTWHYLELKFQQVASGRARVRVDGATVLDESGADLLGSSSAMDQVLLGGADGGVYWSDLLVMDGSGARCSDLLGPRARVALLRPIANGAEADWTASPLAGGAAAALDDAIPGASDGADSYITTSTVGHKSTVTCEKLAPEAERIEAATVLLEAEATTQGVQAIGISGATQSAGSTASLNAVGGGYRVARHTMHNDPASGGRLTRASVEALRVGGLAV